MGTTVFESSKSMLEFQAICRLNNVISATLFGSQANGTATKKSDYDLILVYQTQKSFFKRYDDFNEIYSLFDNYLDLLIYTPEEWERIKYRKFFLKAIQEGKTLYEQ